MSTPGYAGIGRGSEWRPKGDLWGAEHTFTRAEIMFARTCRALPPPVRPPDRDDDEDQR